MCVNVSGMNVDFGGRHSNFSEGLRFDFNLCIHLHLNDVTGISPNVSSRYAKATNLGFVQKKWDMLSLRNLLRDVKWL